jgi:hypothetical protein
MEEPEDIIWKNLGFYKRHLDLFDSVNENPSVAARIILDSIINGKDKLEKKKQADNLISFVALGLMFFFLSYLMSNPLVMLACNGIGAFLFAYGAIGSVKNALSRTKKIT